jgi:hypothetical protein
MISEIIEDDIIFCSNDNEFFHQKTFSFLLLSYASGTGIIEPVPQGRVPQKIREK